MSFCPKCGAQTSSAMAFCTACGASLSRAEYPQAAPAAAPGGVPAPAAYAPAPAVARGPKGTTREPWLVILLSIVTLGIYAAYFWWVTSREVDAYAGTPGRSHSLVRIGVVMSVVSVLAMVFLFFTFITAVFGIAASGVAPEAPGAVGAMLGMFATFGIVSILVVVGAVILLVGKYRVWEAIEADERRRQHPAPLSAVLMLVLTIASFFVPFVGIVLPLVVLYMTQDHLNQAWATAA